MFAAIAPDFDRTAIDEFLGKPDIETTNELFYGIDKTSGIATIGRISIGANGDRYTPLCSDSQYRYSEYFNANLFAKAINLIPEPVTCFQKPKTSQELTVTIKDVSNKHSFTDPLYTNHVTVMITNNSNNTLCFTWAGLAENCRQQFFNADGKHLVTVDLRNDVRKNKRTTHKLLLKPQKTLRASTHIFKDALQSFGKLPDDIYFRISLRLDCKVSKQYRGYITTSNLIRIK